MTIINLSSARVCKAATAEQAADAAARAIARDGLARILTTLAASERQAPGAEGVGLRELIREAAALLALRHGADAEEAAEEACWGAALALAENGAAIAADQAEPDVRAGQGVAPGAFRLVVTADNNADALALLADCGLAPGAATIRVRRPG